MFFRSREVGVHGMLALKVVSMHVFIIIAAGNASEGEISVDYPRHLI